MEYQIAPHEYVVETKIQSSDVDVFGHVNNVSYFRLMEQARIDLFWKNQIDEEAIRKMGTGPVILEFHTKFFKELKLGQQVKIVTQITEYRGRVGKMEHRIETAGKVAHCTSVLTIGILDIGRRELILPPERWLTAFHLSPKAAQKAG